MSTYPTAEAPNVLVVDGVVDELVEFTELHMAGGRVVRLPTSLLRVNENGPTRLMDVAEDAVASGTEPDETVISLIEERLEVGKRTVATGVVRLRKTVHEFETALDEPLAIRTYDVERVVLNHSVEVAPPVRHEGDTTIYPLVEEQLILTKQLVLKEEIRVTKRDTERRDTQVVRLRREHVSVEREPIEREPS